MNHAREGHICPVCGSEYTRVYSTESAEKARTTRRIRRRRCQECWSKWLTAEVNYFDLEQEGQLNETAKKDTDRP